MIPDIINGIVRVEGVIIVGAHDGRELTNYISRGAMRISLFEPQRDIFEILLGIVKDLPCAIRAEAYNVGLSNEAKSAVLYKASNDGLSSSILKPLFHLQQYPDILFTNTENITLITGDSVSSLHEGYDFMQIDVQGAELLVLQGCQKLIKNLRHIVCEVNIEELYEGCARVQEIDRFLQESGFVRVKTIWNGTTWGDALYSRE
jgi:FkbM family methyltransferase